MKGIANHLDQAEAPSGLDFDLAAQMQRQITREEAAKYLADELVDAGKSIMSFFDTRKRRTGWYEQPLDVIVEESVVGVRLEVARWNLFQALSQDGHPVANADLLDAIELYQEGYGDIAKVAADVRAGRFRNAQRDDNGSIILPCAAIDDDQIDNGASASGPAPL